MSKEELADKVSGILIKLRAFRQEYTDREAELLARQAELIAKDTGQ